MNALITGGTKGIGKAIVEILLANGVDVHVNARNTKDLEFQNGALQTIFEERTITYSSNDLSKPEEVDQLVKDYQSNFDSLDILVNNAGVFLPGNTCEEESGTLESMIETNLYSAYNLTRALMPMIEQSKAGHIFNMCSIASKIAYPNGGSYSISKFALYGYTKVLREELKGKGIKVTAILPGATWSNSWAGVDLPRERLIEAHDIAISVWSAICMSPSAVVEEIIIRPQLGDL